MFAKFGTKPAHIEYPYHLSADLNAAVTGRSNDGRWR